MSSRFRIDHSALSESALIYSSKMDAALGTSRKFNLSDYGFTSSDAPMFCKWEQTCGGHWGKRLYGYYYMGNPIPLIDSTTVPVPYINKVGSSYYRHFPSSDTPGVKYTPLTKGSTHTLEYNPQTQVLTVDGVTIHTTDTIIIDVQAAGGNGGMGHSDQWTNRDVLMSAMPEGGQAGGGGGGSGAFASFIPLLENRTIYIKTDNNGSVTVSSSINDDGAFTIGAGSSGTAGSITLSTRTVLGVSIQELASISGGAGGAGGKVSVPAGSALPHAYIINTIEGASGSSGSCGNQGLGFWNKQQTGGTTGNCPVQTLSPIGVSGTSMQCAHNGTSTLTTAGSGEPITADSPQYLAGGGGGAASIMGNGSSHGYAGSTTAGTGAGGFGGSAWGNSTSYESGLGGDGGAGAMWIYYCPL